MGRVVGGLACALVSASVAHAGGPTRKVTIETEPEGATVYLNDKENGPKCEKTPCTIDLPAGEAAVVIIELENYAEEFEQVDVPAKRDSKPLKVHYELKAAIGTLVVNGAPGATVEVDGKDKGKTPARIEMPEGAYRVVVKQGTKTLYDEYVQVDSGNEATVTPRSGGSGPVAIKDTPEPTDPGEPTAITKPATPGKPRGNYFLGSGAFDVGFRKFSYDGNQTKMTLRDESEVGQVLAGPVLEVWPTEIAGLDLLHGLSILARFEFGLNSQTVSGNGLGGTTTTFWQSYEFSLRNRWVLANTGTIEVGVGYVRDTYRFNGAPSDVMLVPDADYQSIRLGVRGSLLLDPVEPYIVLENRIVLDGGSIAKRFALGADANGLHGGLGLAAHFGHLNARFEAAITDYSWTFKPDAGATFIASGGSDRIEEISLSVGYSY